MSRFAWLLLLILPLAVLPYHAPATPDITTPTAPLQTWNPDSLAWSTVLIWTERPTGLTLTSGFLIDKVKRRVIAARHALENLRPDGTPLGMIEKFYVLWPDADSTGQGVITSSDHYFQRMRQKQIPPARLLAQDASRDLVLLEAGSEPPPHAQPLSLHLDAVEPSTKIVGVAQPFTRGSLWHPFTASVSEVLSRKLSYARQGQPVALYLAQAEQNVEFGYSGSPLVLPHNGKLVGMLLAAQTDRPHCFALINSQEIHRFLAIE